MRSPAFASEPASLVVACRRVLRASSRARGAVVGVRRGSSPRPTRRAPQREAERLLDADRTANRLAALPLLEENEIVAVVGWPNAVDEALAERIDLPAVAVRGDGVDPCTSCAPRALNAASASWTSGIRRSRTSPVCSFPAAAIGPAAALVPAGTRRRSTSSDGRPRGVARRRGRSRAAPPACSTRPSPRRRRATTRPPRTSTIPNPSCCALERFETASRGHVASSRRWTRPRAVDCPVVPELLRRR